MLPRRGGEGLSRSTAVEVGSERAAYSVRRSATINRRVAAGREVDLIVDRLQRPGRQFGLLAPVPSLDDARMQADFEPPIILAEQTSIAGIADLGGRNGIMTCIVTGSNWSN